MNSQARTMVAAENRVEGTVFLPSRYEDEPLYGIAARYAALLGMTCHMRVASAIFGDARLTAVDLPTGLEMVARRCGPSLNLDLAGIVSELTLAPLYLHHVDDDLADACRAAMASRGRTSVPNLLGLATSRVRPPRWLRYCPLCVREQRARLGECHWRRAHQIAGVGACADHACLLVASDVPRRMGGDRRLFDAESSLPAALRLDEKIRSASETSVSIARRCAALLSGWVRRDDGQPSNDRWSRAPGLESRGRDILVAFRERFGADELKGMGCDVDPDDPQDWLLCMLRPSRARRHALQHVLLDMFAEGRPDLLVLRQEPPEGGPRRGSDHDHAGRAAPPRADERRTERPRRAAHACDGGVTVGKPAHRDEHRGARQRSSTTIPGNQRRVDWPGRDDEWASRLRAASVSLAEVRPPRKITRPCLISAAGLPVGATDVMDRLPRSRAVVAAAVETIDAFECRRVSWAVTELERRHRPVTAQQVRSLSKLTGPIGTPARAAIQEACAIGGTRGFVTTLFESEND